MRTWLSQSRSGEQIAVPAHAYLTDAGYGSGWACERGYRASGSTCVEIDVPENGYLSTKPFSQGWRCNRGFREAEGSCLTLVMPANAHLTHSGNDWECDTFFQCVGSACDRPD